MDFNKFTNSFKNQTYWDLYWRMFWKLFSGLFNTINVCKLKIVKMALDGLRAYSSVISTFCYRGFAGLPMQSKQDQTWKKLKKGDRLTSFWKDTLAAETWTTFKIQSFENIILILNFSVTVHCRKQSWSQSYWNCFKVFRKNWPAWRGH